MPKATTKKAPSKKAAKPAKPTPAKKAPAPAQNGSAAKAEKPEQGTSPEALATNILAPVKSLAQQPGMRQRLADEMNAVSGQKFTRQMIERWVLDEKTVEPKLGNALLLLHVANRIAPEAVPALAWQQRTGGKKK